MNMKTLKQKIRIFSNHQKPVKLQFKLFMAYLLIASVILISFAVFFYQYVSIILIDNEKAALATLNTSIADQVDAVIHDLDITSANINYSSLMSDKLDDSFGLNIADANLTEMADLFVTINGSDIRADQINLFDMHGNEVKVGIITNTDQVDIHSLDWFDEVIERKGVKLIGDPYLTSAYSLANVSSDWYLSVYRTYSNQYGRKVGAIETIKRCKNVFKSAASYEKKTKDAANIYIFNEKGFLVYPYAVSAEEKEQLSYYYQTISDQKTDFVTNPMTDKKEHLVYSRSTYSHWTYVTTQKESVILTPVRHLSFILFMVVLVLLAFSVLVSYYLSQSMIKPVKHLKHIVQRLEIDTLGVEEIANYNPSYVELAELYEAFENMSGKLKMSMNELIDTRQQELKSRTMALQAQMNPHFYYNTLSCIIVLAENEKSDEVIVLCRYLSQIMRYITDTSSSAVKLEQELEYVKKYLYCMKVRYQSSLTCEISIDSRLLQYEVPKLVIQPLVENALKYGTDCIPPWTIRIIGTLHADHWQIDVIDSGNGFSEDAISMIHEKITHADQNPGMPELKIDGLGILNVYMRWRIFQKERAIFSFGNTPEGHGIVSIGQWLDHVDLADAAKGENL